MIAKRIWPRWILAWMVALLALVGGRGQADSTISIESPRDGATVAAGALPRPHGSAGSSSGVGGVQVLLQRAGGAKWLSWNGDNWQDSLAVLPADYDAVSRQWVLSSRVALPASTSLAPGSYRVQAQALARNGSVLGRAQSAFVVGEAPLRRAAPGNDLPSRATVLTGATGKITGTTVGATAQGPNGQPDNTYGDIFYRWIAPAGATRATFSTAGTPTGDYVLVHRVEANGSFTLVADSPNVVAFDVAPGREYFIEQVARFGAQGATLLRWGAGPKSPNDTAGTATAISGTSGRVVGQNLGASGHYATFNPNALDISAPDVYWKWKPPAANGTRSYTFSTAGSSFRGALNIYSLEPGASSPYLSAVAQGVVIVTFQADPSKTYYIEVSGADHEQGNIALAWNLTGLPLPGPPPPPPVFSVVRGRVTNNGAGMPNVTVFLVPGISPDPLFLSLMASGAPPVPVTRTSSDGSYTFPNVRAGKYWVVPVMPRVLMAPHMTAITAPLVATASINFAASLPDPVGPRVTVASLDKKLVDGRHLITFGQGKSTDGNAAFGLPGSGTLAVGYAVYRLRSDAGSLALPAEKRGIEAVFSRRSKSFVASSGGLPTADNLHFAEVNDRLNWRTGFTPEILAAYGPGTHRLAIVTMDRAYNFGLNPSNSTDPERPANSRLTFAHFAVIPPRLGVTRSLPLSVANGKIATYTITVSNPGDVPLPNVAVRQTINTDKTKLVSGSVKPAATIVGRDVLWSVGNLPAHSSRTLQLQVTASDGNVFGSNISAGNLSVTSTAGNFLFSRDQINIESSAWVIGNLVNALRAVGDAIGHAFTYTFSSSARDQRAQQDLNTIKAGSLVTRVAGLDFVQFDNGNLLIPLGAGQVLALGPHVRGGNLVDGGGITVASGAGNVVVLNGLSSQSVLGTLFTNPAAIVAQGAGNLVAQGGGNIVAQGAGNLISNDGGSLISNDGGSLISNDGAGLISNDGGSLSRVSLRLRGGVSELISNDGGSIVRLNGAGVINGGGAVLLAGSGNLVASGGGNLVASGGGNLVASGAGN